MTALSQYERERLARIEAAPDAPESFDAVAALRRVMALADLWDATAESLSEVAKDYGLFQSEASNAARRACEKRVQQHRDAARDLRRALGTPTTGGGE